MFSSRKEVFHYENIRHVPLATCTKLHGRGWDNLLHLPYFSDIAPPDCHLFVYLRNSLKGNSFNVWDGVKTHLDDCFSSKITKFHTHGTFKLPAT